MSKSVRGNPAFSAWCDELEIRLEGLHVGDGTALHRHPQGQYRRPEHDEPPQIERT